MKVKLGREGLNLTWQRNFPEEVSCVHCKGVSRIGFVAFEDTEEGVSEPRICSLHDNEGQGGFWPHDCCAIAVYFCKECILPTAIFNQA